jgi:hypothetical protein
MSMKRSKLKRLWTTGAHHAGLPDGLFSYQKSQFGQILESLGMENVWYFL